MSAHDGFTRAERGDHGTIGPAPAAMAALGPAGTGAVVVAQLGQSLDGRIATPTGDSRWINGEAALTHLHALRAAVDGVVIGVGTLVADDPLLTVRRVRGRHPARIVIDPRGRAPLDAKVFRDDGTRRILLRAAPGPLAPGVEEIVVPPGPDGRLPPPAIVAALAAAGLPRLLIEGGASTVSAFLDAAALDRLHILVGQVIIGSGSHGIGLAPVTWLRDALRPKVAAHPLPDGDVLFDCAFDRGG